MKLSELATMLEATHYPVAYRAFPEPQALPVICYLETSSDNFGADNKVYTKIADIAVELYTKVKDPAAEATLEAVFEANNIFWQSQETYLDDEKCYEVVYTFQIYEEYEVH